jgi:HAD superfamily hydrolase (TIGR01509 family)
MNNIKAIIFDYGNVIAHVDHLRFFNAVAPRSALTLQQMFDEHRKEPNLIVEYESGRMTSEEFIATSMQRLQLSMSAEEFHSAFTDIFQRIHSTITLIRQLKPHYKIGLLSNTNTIHFKSEIETVEVFPLFDTVTLSYEVGAMKPLENIYHDALTKLALQPNECAYIDDIPEYVGAAAKCDINAIHYTSHDNLLASLDALGVRRWNS